MTLHRAMRLQGTLQGMMALAVGAVLVGGCNTSVQQPQAVQQTSPPALTATPAVTINAVMVALVDHAGHALWDVEKNGRAPKTDADWREIEHHAIQLAAAGTLIALGGTGPADPGWAQLPDWKKHARALTDAGLTSLKAVRSKDLRAVITANGDLVEVCEACHKEFKPALPTEGIVHPHEER